MRHPLALRLDEHRHQFGHPKEPDLVALGAGLGGDRRREVALAGAGVSNEEHVLSFVDERTARELQDHHLVDRWSRQEVEGGE